jgi:omega-6 fatty acid desaturase (delta-12 desaturase)
VYSALLVLMYRALSISWLLTLLISLPTAGVLMRLFVIQHDCGHASFFRRKWQNDLLGTVIGIFTLTPYEYWLKQHSRHHKGAGNLAMRGDGDVLTLTVEEYRQAARIRRIWYRIYRNPICLFFVLAPLHFMVLQRVPLGYQMKFFRSWLTVMLTNLATALLLVAFAWWLGIFTVLLVYVPVVAFAAVTGTWFFYVQHQFDKTYWQDASTWSFDEAAMKGSSYYVLPRLINWFTGDIAFHHIHHLRSRIPNYYLRKCYEENPIFWQAQQLTLWQSFKAAKLALWDASKQRLISFRDAHSSTVHAKSSV